MDLVAELRAALAGVRGFQTEARDVSAEARRGLEFYPVIGLAIGMVAAIAANATARLVPRAAGFAGFLVLTVLGGPRNAAATAAAAGVVSDRPAPRLGEAAAAGLLLALKCAGLVVLPPPARTAALVLAPLLGTWALVVQCYGPRAASGGEARSLIGGAGFREFGVASLFAFGVTFGLAQAIGLTVAVVAALVTIGLRVVAHRRADGMTPALAAATRELVETGVVGTLALLAVGPRL